MSEMIERVTLATCSAIPCICKNRLKFEGMPCLERGKRGVEAMREPTEAMIAAGAVRWHEPVRYGDARLPYLGDASMICWDRAIDAALKGG